MENSRENKKEELLRLIKWIADYPDMWTKVTTENFLSAEECIEVIKELERQEFYLLIPVFLERCMGTEMGAGINRLIAYKLIECWKNETLQDIEKEINGFLQNP